MCDMHTSTEPRTSAFAALSLGMVMASLDTNIVVAVLPSLAADLGQPDAIGGVTAAYLLAVAVATPLHGSLGDRWGRRVMFVGSVVVFASGSLACALAPSMGVLIGFRAVQGLGGSGLIVAAVAGMAELFSRDEMLRRQGWLTAAFAVSAIGGAPLGGFLAATTGWPAIFLVNLPISAIALTLGARSVPTRRPSTATPTPEAQRSVPRRFDVIGAVLIVIAGSSAVALGSLVRSPLLLVVAVVATVAFVWFERRTPAPLIPPALFTDRTVGVTLLSGVALFGSFTYVPLAITTDPATTGLLLLPMSAGQVVATTGFAALARRWPRLTTWGRLGLTLGVVGLLGTAAVPVSTGPLRIVITVAALALSGAALGLSMQAYTLLAQSRAPRETIGATMATLTFTRQIGGSLGIALFGWTLTNGVGWVFITAAAFLVAAVMIAPRSQQFVEGDR
ncbi:MFS transporter [Kibdelosporangium lantanae]